MSAGIPLIAALVPSAAPSAPPVAALAAGAGVAEPAHAPVGDDRDFDVALELAAAQLAAGVPQPAPAQPRGVPAAPGDEATPVDVPVTPAATGDAPAPSGPLPGVASTGAPGEIVLPAVADLRATFAALAARTAIGARVAAATTATPATPAAPIPAGHLRAGRSERRTGTTAAVAPHSSRWRWRRPGAGAQRPRCRGGRGARRARRAERAGSGAAARDGRRAGSCPFAAAVSSRGGRRRQPARDVRGHDGGSPGAAASTTTAADPATAAAPVDRWRWRAPRTPPRERRALAARPAARTDDGGAEIRGRRRVRDRADASGARADLRSRCRPDGPTSTSRTVIARTLGAEAPAVPTATPTMPPPSTPPLALRATGRRRLPPPRLHRAQARPRRPARRPKRRSPRPAAVRRAGNRRPVRRPASPNEAAPPVAAFAPAPDAPAAPQVTSRVSRAPDVPTDVPTPAQAAADRAAGAMRTGDRVTVRFDGEDGIHGRIRLAMRGDTLHATIVSTGAGLEPGAGARELERLLGERGFAGAHVTVQEPAAASAGSTPSFASDGQAPRDDARREAFARAHDERAQSDSQGRPGRQRPRHPEEEKA